MLIVAPWTTFWDRNYFVEALPTLEAFFTSHAVRGGVTGFGVLSVSVALFDVASTIVNVFAPDSAVSRDDSMLADVVPRP